MKFYNESRKVFEKVNSILTKDIDTNDLDILLDTLIEYEFTECFVVE